MKHSQMATIRSLLIASLAFVFCSCHQKEARIKQLIVGEWKLAAQEDLDTSDMVTGIEYPHTAFIFYEDGTYEYPSGFFSDRRKIFEGTRSQYSIKGDSLKMLCPGSQRSWGRRISEITNDTLTFADNGTLSKFVKAQNKPVSVVEFDAILVSATGCYGPCPVNDVLISQNGKVIYYGKQFNTANGLYSSTLSPSMFSEVAQKFQKANIESLKTNYEANWSDDESITVTLVNKGRIVKTIHDYGSQSPSELVWAYTYARYLYQQLKLDTLSALIPLPGSFGSALKRGSQVGFLSQSETFYLWNLIREGNKVEKKFRSLYSIEFSGEKVETDGRFFRIQSDNGQTQTIDIGFDFIKDNGLDKRMAEAANIQ